MTVQTRQTVSLLDLAKGAARMAPDLPILIKGAPGLLLRKPKDKKSVGLLLQELAAKQPDRPFLKFEGRTETYGEANRIVNRYAAVLTERGVQRGDVVGLLARNELETVLVSLAIVKIGAVAGLLNYNQRGEVLAHSLGVLGAPLVVVGDDCVEDLASAGAAAEQQSSITFSQLRAEAEGKSDADPAVTADIAGSEQAFYIFTSGTTGMPKASIMSHFRWLKSYSGLGGLGVRLRPDDTMYVCLPLYHNNAITVALGAVFAGGASMAIGRKFSASGFWDEIRTYDATAFVYIGELCRYLLAQPAKPTDRDHKVRVIVGNGLRPDVWAEFQERFGIARIAEFYGASECNIAFINAYNVDETAGTCPLPYKVVAYDQETGDPARDANGRLTKVKRGDVGLLLAKVTNRAPFDGYTDDDATEKKLVRNGFKDGDTWFNTGDLGEVDEDGFVRITGRKKDLIVTAGGKNISPGPMEEIIRQDPLISNALVVGDGKPFVGVLVTLDEEELKRWKANHNIPANRKLSELALDPALRAEVQDAVNMANATVSRTEAIKKFRILDRDLSERHDEITQDQIDQAKIVKQG